MTNYKEKRLLSRDVEIKVSSNNAMTQSIDYKAFSVLSL